MAHMQLMVEKQMKKSPQAEVVSYKRSQTSYVKNILTVISNPIKFITY